ncbi:MAG: amidohydrolase family protein, partial [Acidimicrobiia bacterium]
MTGGPPPHDDELPLELGAVSNGETVPVAPSPVLRETARRARELIDHQARRRGMPRRDFLRTTMAAAAVLLTLDACSSESSGGRSGGTLRVPEDATVDPEAAREALGGDEFVMDVQTHFLDLDPAQFADPGFPQSSCGASDPRLCYSIDAYLEELFLRSDTSIAVISAIPAAGDDGPLAPERMDEARRAADALCGDGRVLMHGQAIPQIGALDQRLDDMDALVERYPISSWKVYTHTPGPGWFLDDHDPASPQVGQAFLDRVRASGVTTVSVHKGLSGNDAHASPVDIGPAAAANRDVRFVVYHSGYESAGREGPYSPAGGGVDRLLSSLEASGIGPGENVYAELGSTWFLTMRDPDQAAHVLGKLLRALGPDRIVWGTDSIWYGSPQRQIEAFRAFEITPEYQERFGYPA